MSEQFKEHEFDGTQLFEPPLGAPIERAVGHRGWHELRVEEAINKLNDGAVGIAKIALNGTVTIRES
jgi:hypothetical protein